MVKRALVPILFAALLAAGYGLSSRGALLAQSPAVAGQDAETSPLAERPQPGTFPDTWIHGADCDADPAIQVHAYNEDLYILRQSKCDTYEAPFLFLLFGEEKALLIDTGSSVNSPVQSTVATIVQNWLTARGKASIELVVAHSHSHGDHVLGDPQFQGQHHATVVGHGTAEVMSFFGFSSWPDEVVQYDLGGRVLDLLATPGHKADSLTFYDRRTDLLLTGDIVYPGHLFIFSPNEFLDFQNSLVRLSEWAERNPVKWVLGCHIEMTADAGVSYQYGTKVQPDEHVLQLKPSVLPKIRDAALAMGADAQCQTFDEFVIHPVYKCGFGYF